MKGARGVLRYAPTNTTGLVSLTTGLVFLRPNTTNGENDQMSKRVKGSP